MGGALLMEAVERLAGLGDRAFACSWFMQPDLRHVPQSVMFLFMGMLLVGCSTRVEYLTPDIFPARDSQVSVEWLEDEPPQPYIELARITVSQTFAGEGRLRQMILAQARALGADAVVDDGVTREVTPGGPPYYEPALMGRESPYYEAGLLGPKGAAFGLYGYGWYSPFSSNPYILIQGATDQPKVAKSLSAVAIRYQAEPRESGGR